MSFVGPLGWPYPILNLFLNLVEGMKGRGGTDVTEERRSLELTRPILRTNIEKISWIDWRGRERTTEIHREVR